MMSGLVAFVAIVAILVADFPTVAKVLALVPIGFATGMAALEAILVAVANVKAQTRRDTEGTVGWLGDLKDMTDAEEDDWANMGRPTRRDAPRARCPPTTTGPPGRPVPHPTPARRCLMRRHDGTAGRIATFDGYCVRCDRPIVRGVSQVVARGHGRWIHVECASGADEE